jgi:DNA polymerase zeta
VNKDPRNEPQYRERVPYVVFQDSSKIRVKDRCISPEDFIKSYNTLKPLSLDNEYYITRVLIPPLERVFNLIGVDIKGWYKELPKFNHELFETKNNIFQFAKFIKSNSCACCGSKLKEYSRSKYICGQCLNNELELIANLSMSSKFGEFKELVADKTCELCVNMNYESLGSRTIRNCMNECVNNSCLVYYNKIRVTKEKVQLDQKHLHLLSDLEW